MQISEFYGDSSSDLHYYCSPRESNGIPSDKYSRNAIIISDA